MEKIYSLFLVLFSLFVFVGKGYCSGDFYDDPDFSPRIDMSYSIVLSSAMQSALNKYDKDFKVWDSYNFEPIIRRLFAGYENHDTGYGLVMESPSALFADFNCDNVMDAVLLGHNKNTKKLIALLSSGSSYKVVVIMDYYLGRDIKEDQQNTVFIGLTAPGKIPASERLDRPELNLKCYGFTYGGENATLLYVYKDGEFKEYAMSD